MIYRYLFRPKYVSRLEYYKLSLDDYIEYRNNNDWTHLRAGLSLKEFVDISIELAILLSRLTNLES